MTQTSGDSGAEAPASAARGREPHRVHLGVVVGALAVGFLVCKLPLVSSGGLAAALAGTLALMAAVPLLLLLLARLTAADAATPTLIAAALVGAGLSALLRSRGLPDAAAELAFDLALVAAAAAAGRLFANEVQEAWWIVPLGITGGVADLVSVFVPGAPTHELVAKRSWLLDYLLVVWPGFSGGGARGFLGVSDLVVAAILYALSVRFAFPARRSFLALAAALWICLATAGLAGLGLPAIPFLFVFYVAAHAKELRASRRKAV